MGREVRKVPRGWQHPKDHRGHWVPLYGRDYAEAAAEWEADCAKWRDGWRPDYAREETRALPNTALAYALWGGDRPTPGTHMPDCSDCTHLQMYENTTEGTPISPVMETPEQLARWLVDNSASAFGENTATYDQWLLVCRGFWVDGNLDA